MKINPETDGWSRRYQAALRRYLARGPETSLRPALVLGRRAVALGMETLDIARVHERTLAAVAEPGGSPVTRQRMIKQAGLFFAETIVPVEKTHPAAL